MGRPWKTELSKSKLLNATESLKLERVEDRNFLV